MEPRPRIGTAPDNQQQLEFKMGWSISVIWSISNKTEQYLQQLSTSWGMVSLEELVRVKGFTMKSLKINFF